MGAGLRRYDGPDNVGVVQGARGLPSPPATLAPMIDLAAIRARARKAREKLLVQRITTGNADAGADLDELLDDVHDLVAELAHARRRTELLACDLGTREGYSAAMARLQALASEGASTTSAISAAFALRQRRTPETWAAWITAVEGLDAGR